MCDDAAKSWKVSRHFSAPRKENSGLLFSKDANACAPANTKGCRKDDSERSSPATTSDQRSKEEAISNA